MKTIAAACCAALTLCAASAGAQPAYPAHTITIVNPYAAGSSTDLMARALAAQFAANLGGTAIVATREGASGVIGMSSVVQAAPDGYTLGYVPMATVTTQPHLNSSSKVNPDTVEPICGVTENVLGIVVRADSPYMTIGELFNAAKTKPLSYGTPGPNSGPFMGIGPLVRQEKLDAVHVPYKGDAAALNDLLGGNIDFAGSIAASATPFIKSGKVRLLAVMSTVRHPGFPAVPTLVEAGYNITSLSYAGLFAPKGTPARVLQTLEKACADAVASTPLKQLAASANQVIRFQDRGQWSKQVRDDFTRQATLLRELGIKPN